MGSISVVIARLPRPRLGRVGGDDLLVDHVRDLDALCSSASSTLVRRSCWRVESRCKAGSGEAPDPIQRVTSAPAPPEGLVLDALADQIQKADS
jgi:hypothetical protein